MLPLLLRVAPFVVRYLPAISAALSLLDRFTPKTPPSSGLTSDPSYLPPFRGGQCAGVIYDIRLEVTAIILSSNSRINYLNPTTYGLTGAFLGTRIVESPSGYTIYLDRSSGNSILITGISKVAWKDPIVNIISVTRRDGLPDNCGDLPNPNPSDPQNNPIPTGGLLSDAGRLISAGESSPDIAPKPLLDDSPVEGALPAIGIALGKALAGLNSILSLLNQLLDLFNKLKKKEKKREIKLFNFGDLEKDGFCNLSSVVNEGYTPIKIQLLVYQKPAYLTKQIRNRSPFFYFSPLGRIDIVDAAFGVIQKNEVNYVREHFNIATDDAIGFYYYFGLSGLIKVQCSILCERFTDE